MSRLHRIDGALAAVEAARKLCPFHSAYTGSWTGTPHSPCPKCRQRRNGDGGRCVVDSAEHQAIKDIEEVLA